MDNSIGAMFITLLNAAMQPMLERIETLEQDLLTQDKAIGELEKQNTDLRAINLAIEAQVKETNSSPAGVMQLLMTALENGYGPYREFNSYVEATVEASQTIKDMKENLPGDASDQADALFNSRYFKDKLNDWLAYTGYTTADEVKEILTEEGSGITEEDAREYANEEIDSRDFLDEEKAQELFDNKIADAVQEKLESASISLSFS